jgi:hypothetical protein
MGSEWGEDGKLVFRSLFCCDASAIKNVGKTFAGGCSDGFRWFRRFVQGEADGSRRGEALA